jgi:ubiquitin C-terminal hydrolase
MLTSDSSIDASQLQAAVAEVNPRFQGNEQQEAHAWFSELLSILHEDLNEATGGTPDTESDFIASYWAKN